MDKCYYKTISQLSSEAPKLGTRGRAVSDPCLHYCAPSAGGWGIVRTALLIPESVLLFVAPHGCGRHGSVAAIQLNLRNRIFYMDVTEEDLVIGSHIDRIPDVVDSIIGRLGKLPPVFLICASCIDDLLASDYKNLMRRLSKLHGIPFIDCHMNPITANSNLPPPLNIQRSIYEPLCREPQSRTTKPTINIVGTFSPIVKESEFYDVTKQAGIEAVHQISAFDSYNDYLQMKNSSHNLLLKPFGRLACQKMQDDLGIPYLDCFIRYNPQSIAKQYKEMSKFLGVELNYMPHCNAALEHKEKIKDSLKGLKIGVGTGVNGSAFDIALTLAQCGAQITFILADAIMGYEWPMVEALKKLNPDLPVYTSYHPSMAILQEVEQSADVAIGFSASYVCPSAKLLPLDADEQHFGFESFHALTDGVIASLSSNISARALLYSKGLVV